MTAHASPQDQQPTPGGSSAGDTVALRLAALADEELALVLDGRADELEHLHARREDLMARLPPVLSAVEVGALRQAAGVQHLVTLALTERHAAVRTELSGLHRGRAAAHGYARTDL